MKGVLPKGNDFGHKRSHRNIQTRKELSHQLRSSTNQKELTLSWSRMQPEDNAVHVETLQHNHSLETLREARLLSSARIYYHHPGVKDIQEPSWNPNE